MVSGLKFSNVPRQLKFIPDRKSERQSPFHKNQRVVFAKLCHPDGTPFFGCPRTVLSRAIDDLKALGYEVKIGIEIEFIVVKMPSENPQLSGEPVLLEPIEFNNDSNLHSLVNQVDDFEEIYQLMQKNDIQIEAIHKECSAGQFEIVLKYGDVFKVLDNYYLAKEIIS